MIGPAMVCPPGTIRVQQGPRPGKEEPMKYANRIGRLGVLAVGLGIGAAMAATGTAVADDFQISIDGIDLFPTAGNTATAVSGAGDMAIAFGAGSDAVAEGGFGNFASADSGATAVAGDEAAGASGNNFDVATATGNDSIADAGNGFGALPDTTGSSFDSAGVLGNDSLAVAGDNGSGDSASAVGQGVVADAGFSQNAAAPSNFDSATVVGNLSTPTTALTEALAGGIGPSTLGGSGDSSFVVDPFGTVGSYAVAGLGSNSDLAGVLGDGLHATATGANFLVDILPSLF
jgi:hypothetical protein